MRRQDKQLVVENIEIYNYYRERLINMALSQFEWHGLPDTMDEWYFERTLLFNGTAAMYKPSGMNDTWLGTGWVQTGGNFDVYGYPLHIAGYGYAMQGQIETEEFEILYDNRSRTVLLPKIEMYAKLLWEIHNTYRENLKAQRCPYIIGCNKNESLSYDNIVNRIDGFDPVIKVKDAASIQENINVLDLNSKFLGSEITDNLKVYWNEALNMLGITGETSKKERMITDELVLNRQQDVITMSARLKNRIDFCNKMNKKYGLNLSVNEVNQDTDFQPFAMESYENGTVGKYQRV